MSLDIGAPAVRDQQQANDLMLSLLERITAFLVWEAESITKYPFELHENAQRFRMMATDIKDALRGQNL